MIVGDRRRLSASSQFGYCTFSSFRCIYVYLASLRFSCRLQPHDFFFPIFQASKAKPEAGVERRGEVKTTDFDQINEKRSPVTNIIQQNASISDSVIEL